MSDFGDPMDCSTPGSSVRGFSRPEYCSVLPFPSPVDLPDPGIEFMFSALAGRFFTAEPLGKTTSLLLFGDFKKAHCIILC